LVRQSSKRIAEYLGNKVIGKTIYVRGKIINFIVK
jgi:hypothetical protein